MSNQKFHCIWLLTPFGAKKNDTNPLIDDLSVGLNVKKRYERIVWTDIDRILQKKLMYALKNKHYIIKLSETDFDELPLNYNDLPDTMSSIIEVYHSKVFIKNISGASATNLLARFGYGDEELLNHINKITKIEAQLQTDKVLVEIVHLPEARTGNILQRPNIRGYEIPYLGKSSVKNEYQIPLNDILVSVKNTTIILRSKKLNKEILPRLSNAHNYSHNSLPIYNFLCELQTQKKRSSIGFSWNSIYNQDPFLPRVEYENLIISKARWVIETKDIKLFFEDDELLLKIERWQKAIQLPDFVELIEGDNRLLIHLKNENSLRMLFHTIRNRKQFVLEEFLFNDNSIVSDSSGNTYCNQFVISYYNAKKLETLN